MQTVKVMDLNHDNWKSVDANCQLTLFSWQKIEMNPIIYLSKSF